MLWLLTTLTFCTLTAATDLQLNNTAIHVPHTSENNDVSLCVRNILQEITEHRGFIVDVVLMNINHVLQIHKLTGVKKARFMTRSFSWTKSELFNWMYVTSAADFEEFQSGMIQAIDDYYFNPRSNFIIVLESFEDYHHDRMRKFLVFYNIYNVSILARDDDGYGIYSFQSPIHPCNHDERLIAVSHCSRYEKGSFIFPRIKSIRGCIFNLMTYNLFPLINLDNAQEEGIEQRVLRYFEHYADVKIHLIPYSRIDKFGQIVGNFTYTDILEKVSKNYAEGAVGGYFLASMDVRKFSFSYPLTIARMMVVLPRADFESSWQAFFHDTALAAVILVIFLFVIFSIAAYILSLFPARHNDLIRDILIVLGYFLNKVTIYKFKPGVPETILISSFLFTIFIIPYTMQAYMWSIKTHPLRSWEPKEYKEVFGKRTLMLTSEWLKEGIFKDRKECESLIDCLKQVRDRKDKSMYTLATNEDFETFKWMIADEQCNLGLYILKDPLNTVMRTILFRRGSVLERTFDKFTFRFIAAGIIDQHYKELEFKEHLKCKPRYVPAIAPLQMSDFQSSYNVLLAGFCVSAVSFTYEVITYRI